MTEPPTGAAAAEADPTGERFDARPREDAALEEIRRGLSRPQKELPPKYFYDQRGSELFERITRLPEYYLTRTERELLQDWMPRWMADIRPATLLELGAGAAQKSRIVLDAMVSAGAASVYLPVDISADFLEEAANGLAEEYPELRIEPLVADISAELPIPDGLPPPRVFAFLGSTIGNFTPDAAVELLERVAAAMDEEDHFLLGVDLRKDPAVIEAAYDDIGGVTAEFNLNMLRVLNREMGADFDPGAFRHRAFYDRSLHRIEMHLVSERDQRVYIPRAGTFSLSAGESIRTEISCKHDRESVGELVERAGMRLVGWETDPDRLYALAFAAR